MPKIKHNKPSLKTNPFLIVLLLVKFLLIKIGSTILIFNFFEPKTTFSEKQPNKVINISKKIHYPVNLKFSQIKFVVKNSLLSPILLSKLLWRIWLFTIKKIFQLTELPLLLLPKHRGRPRKQLLIKIWYKRFKIYTKTRIPKPAKVGIVVFAIIFAMSSYTMATVKAAYEIPNPNKLTQYEKPLTTEFYDRNGVLLYRLYEGRNRTLVELDQLPKDLVNATIAIEDKNFYYHPGIDPIGILRATYHNFHEDTLQGASTITQQLIKNTILNSERTFGRKLKEAVLAIWTEFLYSKQDILKMYFNESPYGGPFWGVEAAAQGYFGKSARDLNLAESAYIAGLPASPTQYSPYGTKPELGKVRQQEVLRRMREDGYITQEQEEIAFNQTLEIQPPTNNIKAAHFVMYVKDLLSQKYGPRVVSQGGLKIYTTLDYSVQEKAEEIVTNEVNSLASLNVKNGAAMVTDPRTGQILAMVGSYDYHDPKIGNYNATIALRQPGSSIKPITYAAAFEKGLSPGNTVMDTPITFRDPWGNNYSPVNYDGAFHGPVSVRQALGSSYNIPAVKLLEKVGVDEMIQLAKKLGISTFNQRDRYGLSITLGAAEVRMIDMMTVYGTFSQNGTKHTLNPILKVIDPSGNILDEYEDNSRQIIKPEIAYLITSVLSDNKARTPAFGPNSLLYFKDTPVGVKTGTTDSKRDNWTIGYTPNYVVGVWVGNNDNSAMDPKLASGITGAAPIWNKIMHTLVDGHLPVEFTRPPGIVDVSVDGRKDIAIGEFVEKQAQVKTQIQSGKAKLDRDSFNVFAATYSAISSRKQTDKSLDNPSR